jgi:hypothetical protein
MDDDLIDALLFHYIGLKWSVKLREVCQFFLESPAWKPNAKPIPKSDQEDGNIFWANRR